MCFSAIMARAISNWFRGGDQFMFVTSSGGLRWFSGALWQSKHQPMLRGATWRISSMRFTGPWQLWQPTPALT